MGEPGDPVGPAISQIIKDQGKHFTPNPPNGLIKVPNTRLFRKKAGLSAGCQEGQVAPTVPCSWLNFPYLVPRQDILSIKQASLSGQMWEDPGWLVFPPPIASYFKGFTVAFNDSSEGTLHPCSSASPWHPKRSFKTILCFSAF